MRLGVAQFRPIQSQRAVMRLVAMTISARLRAFYRLKFQGKEEDFGVRTQSNNSLIWKAKS